MGRVVISWALACLLLTSVAAAQSITPGSVPGPGTLPAPVLLTDNNNYTVPAGVTLLHGVAAAAGGGGGGVSAAAATGSAGLPGIMVEFVMAVTPGQVIAYTSGTAGTRGANTGGNGGTGGDTTFGSITVKGGQGGTGSTSGNGAAVQSAATGGAGTSFSMIRSSTLVPTATVAIISMTGDAITGLGAGTGANGGFSKGIWGTSVAGTNGSATDCVGYNTGGSGAGSTSNTAGTGALGCPGAILLW